MAGLGGPNGGGGGGGGGTGGGGRRCGRPRAGGRGARNPRRMAVAGARTGGLGSRQMDRRVTAAVLAMVASLAAPTAARATDYVVTTTDDAGGCTAGGACSLRGA